MKNNRIALFFGGKVTQHLGMIKKAARREGVEMDLISYNRVCFETNGEKTRAMIRGAKGKEGQMTDINDYGVLFFRTTGKHWEEVDLIINSIDKEKGPVVVDPIVKWGKPSMACKAWQMIALSRAGIPVPKTVYGSLGYLVELMRKVPTDKNTGDSPNKFLQSSLPSGSVPPEAGTRVRCGLKNYSAASPFVFPVIVKGSGGDRGTRVYKADNFEELEKLAKDLRRSEIEEGKRYMLEEYIENRGDYRVLVLGDKVLGVMKRTSGGADFRNNFSAGGKVEVADLPQDIKKMAVEATKVCGLSVAGVDVMPRNNLQFSITNYEFKKSKRIGQKREGYKDLGLLSDKRQDYVILEVNKGPQFKGFMQATGIDVPREIVKFLKQEMKKSSNEMLRVL